MGATGADIDAEEEPARFREAYRILKVIPTVRTMWFSLPFLFGGVLGLLIVLPLFLEEVYGLDAAQRGLLTAFQGAFGIFGLFLGTALTKRYLFSDKPQRMFRLMAGISVAIAVGVCYLAAVQSLALMIIGGTFIVMLFVAGAPRLRHPVLDHHAGEGAHGRLRHHPAVGPPRARRGPLRRSRRRRPRPPLGLVVSLPVFLVGSVDHRRGRSQLPVRHGRRPRGVDGRHPPAQRGVASHRPTLPGGPWTAPPPHLVGTSTPTATCSSPSTGSRPMPTRTSGSGCARSSSPVVPTNESAAEIVAARSATALDDDPLWGRGYKAFGAWDAGERIAILDKHGIDAQLVFSTFAPGQFLSNDLDLLYGGVRAHTRALADFCSADPRLLAVPLVPFVDIDRALEELDAALEIGCGAVLVNTTAPSKTMGPSHPALDPVLGSPAGRRRPVGEPHRHRRTAGAHRLPRERPAGPPRLPRRW